LTASLDGDVRIVKQYPIYDFKTELRVDLKFDLAAVTRARPLARSGRKFPADAR
jgi:hypothetical protein